MQNPFLVNQELLVSCYICELVYEEQLLTETSVANLGCTPEPLRSIHAWFLKPLTHTSVEFGLWVYRGCLSCEGPPEVVL